METQETEEETKQRMVKEMSESFRELLSLLLIIPQERLTVSVFLHPAVADEKQVMLGVEIFLDGKDLPPKEEETATMLLRVVGMKGAQLSAKA